MAVEVICVEECPWREERVKVGGWALRIWDACGMTFRQCCEDVCIGCLCEWCSALLEHDEARKTMERKARVLERLWRRQETERKKKRRRGWRIGRRRITAPWWGQMREHEQRSNQSETQ